MPLADVPPAPAHNALGLPRIRQNKIILAANQYHAGRIRDQLGPNSEYRVVATFDGLAGFRAELILVTDYYRQVEDDRAKLWFNDTLRLRLSPTGRIIHL